MLWLWLWTALADEPLVEGFDRLHVDPETMHVRPTEPAEPAARGTLVIDNGHTARAKVRVGGVPIGELLPRQTGILRDVAAGRYTVAYHLPHGVVRTEVIDAQ